MFKIINLKWLTAWKDCWDHEQKDRSSHLREVSRRDRPQTGSTRRRSSQGEKKVHQFGFIWSLFLLSHFVQNTCKTTKNYLEKGRKNCVVVNLPFSIVLCMAFFPQMFIQNVSNETFAKKRMKSNNVTKNPHFASHPITPFYNESPVVVEVKTRTWLSRMLFESLKVKKWFKNI